MGKKITVVIIFIALIIGAVLQSNTLNAITNEMLGCADKLESELKNGDIPAMKTTAAELNDVWLSRKIQLAMLVEHVEMDRIAFEIIDLVANIYSGNEDMLPGNIERTRYAIKHIQKVDVFSGENIF